jgi:hypothetical protein
MLVNLVRAENRNRNAGSNCTNQFSSFILNSVSKATSPERKLDRNNATSNWSEPAKFLLRSVNVTL